MSGPVMDMPPVVPMLSYEDVGAAADWMASAFGFHEVGRWVGDDGRVTQVNMRAGQGMVMLGWPSSDYESPTHHAAHCGAARAWSDTSFVVDGVLVYVEDVDAHLAIASARGAAILSPLEDNPDVGQRQYRAADLEGHRWMFAQRL